MGKSDAEVIALFNEQVNMTADELEAWLDNPQSRKAGTGVGIESGRRIVEILLKNPNKNPDEYDEQEDIAHIRKVVSYNSRHLAQEDHLKETKTTEELEKAKSTISLKNWGHDPVKVKLQQEGRITTEDSADDGAAIGREGERDTAKAVQDLGDLERETHEVDVQGSTGAESKSAKDVESDGKRKRGTGGEDELTDKSMKGEEEEKERAEIELKRVRVDDDGDDKE
ncbi:hypothetical protein B0F90DRAFT_880033 [Multifurca ochricompacta]|uniref:Uncharacterized protein n=1 Tax=Multifurca ochricompacta TaxID=376703 RepID=A0AAD4M2U3_9AGAM|nr:hypothetical protein B0F90DRAFT_880033 [Multifurca ochricompacta]